MVYDGDDFEGSNMKHFEEIWEDAEKVAKEYGNEYSDFGSYKHIDCVLKDFATDMDSTDRDGKQRLLGGLLMVMAHISDKHGLNSWTALQEGMNQLKIDLLDPDLESEL